MGRKVTFNPPLDKFNYALEEHRIPPRWRAIEFLWEYGTVGWHCLVVPAGRKVVRVDNGRADPDEWDVKVVYRREELKVNWLAMATLAGLDELAERIREVEDSLPPDPAEKPSLRNWRDYLKG